MEKWQIWVRDNRGLTLIELMVAMTIAVVVLTPILELLLTGNKIQIKAFGQVDLQEQVQEVLNRLVEGERRNGARVGGLRQSLASRITVDGAKGLAFVTTDDNANYYLKTYYFKDHKVYYREENKGGQLPDKPSSVVAAGGTPLLDKVEIFQVEEIPSRQGYKLYKITIKAGANLTSGGSSEAILSRVVKPRNL